MVRGAIVVMTFLSLLRESLAYAAAMAGPCAGVVQCLRHSQCAQCLSAVNATAGVPHTYAEFYDHGNAGTREFHVGFFQTLRSTASCSASATPSSILNPALQELSNFSSPCNDAYVDPPPFANTSPAKRARTISANDVCACL